MDLLETIKRLSDSEIECRLGNTFHRGLLVWLGDSVHGYSFERFFTWDEMRQIPGWLDAQARLNFPQSDYAQGR